MSAQPLLTKVDRLWAEFVAARNKAWSPDATIEDGIASSRAYARFLAEHAPEGTVRNSLLGSDVVQLRK